MELQQQLIEVIAVGPDALTCVIRDVVDNKKATEDLDGLLIDYMSRLPRVDLEQFLINFRVPLKRLFGGQGYNALWHACAVIELLTTETIQSPEAHATTSHVCMSPAMQDIVGLM